MAATSRADATWNGDLMKGHGTVKPASGLADASARHCQRTFDTSKNCTPLLSHHSTASDLESFCTMSRDTPPLCNRTPVLLQNITER